MRLSRYFLPVTKETPADAQIVSHKLMLRAGLIRQTAAGIYAWLPLGHRVLKRIEQIVREEQDKAGAIECRPSSRPICGASRAATTPTAPKCSASRTATSARCSTGRPTRK
jgi:hypothetical protein